MICCDKGYLFCCGQLVFLRTAIVLSWSTQDIHYQAGYLFRVAIEFLVRDQFTTFRDRHSRKTKNPSSLGNKKNGTYIKSEFWRPTSTLEVVA